MIGVWLGRVAIWSTVLACLAAPSLFIKLVGLLVGAAAAFYEYNH